MGCCNSRSRTDIIYSIPISMKGQNESEIYRNIKFPDELISGPTDKIQTLQDAFQRNVTRFPERKLFGSRNKANNNQYEYKTYRQVNDIIKKLGSGIVNLKLESQVKYKNFNLNLIAVFSKNREEWFFLDIAAVHYGFVLVPLYDTLRPNDIYYILNETQVSTLFISLDVLPTLLKLNDTANLKTIVLLDEIDNTLKEKIIEKKLKLYKFQEILETQLIPDFTLISSQDPFTFCYTSGTTGVPKGVIQTHKTMTAFMFGVNNLDNIYFDENDVHLSYLPLPHVFERNIAWTCLYLGACICFYGGDVQKLSDDFRDAKPTFFISVPRLFNRIYLKMQEAIQNLTGLKKALVTKAISTKLHNLEVKGQYKHMIYDKLVFNKMKQVFGGKMKLMVTASAPICQQQLLQLNLLEPDIVKFLSIVISGPVIECYGLSETGPVTCTWAFENLFGHMGGPFSSMELKVIDVPEMNYYSSHMANNINIPQGELLIRSPSMFLGYFNQDNKTKESLDEEDWFHTGDIIELISNGAIKLIDRKKHIFKLQQGEYIAVEKIESIYSRVPGVSQIFVYGDSWQSYLVGIIIPDKKFIENLAVSLKIQASFNELCQNSQINQQILNNLIQQGKKDELYGYEQVKVIYLDPKPFEESDLLSATFKLKRNEAKNYYNEIIKKLYQTFP